MPEISIIVPVYNTEKYIHRCVDSILSQTFTDFELLLVDDGSPDNCGTICDEYAVKDNRVRVFHQENQGQAAARNHALDWVLANSESEYIAFVDSDDWVHPRYLELVYEGILRFDVNISQCRHVVTNERHTPATVKDNISCISVEEQYTQYYSAFMWDKLFKRSCWSEMRFPEGQIYEDLAICYRMLFAQKQIALVDAELYFYFHNVDSTVHQDWKPGRMARLDAWDAQVLFFKNSGNRILLETALDHYCQIACNEHYAIEHSESLAKENKEKYQSIIKDRVRKLLSKYWWQQKRMLKKKSPEYRWCLEVVHPIVAGIYWKLHK